MKAGWTVIGTGKTREGIIGKLKADHLSVVIYGTGRFGKAVAEYVIKNGISVLCFLDMEEYWYSGKTITVAGNTVPCLTKGSLLAEERPYNLLAGMVDYTLLDGLRKEFPHCHYVEYLDVYPSHIVTESFLTQNKEIIHEIYDALNDTESRQVLEAYLYSRYTGDVEALCRLIHDKRYLYDWELLELSERDTVIDGGAYTGDSILEMKEYLGGGVLPDKIFAFEPDQNNAMKIASHFSDEEMMHISIVNAGLYSSDGSIHFSASGTLGSGISEEAEDTVVTQALDMHSEYHRAAIIKMDIEGSELEALRGAEALLRNGHPNLAVCIYHRNEDLISIYQYLKKFGYRFYLRQHSASVDETVLYAV